MRINHNNNDTNNSRVALLYFTYSIVYGAKWEPGSASQCIRGRSGIEMSYGYWPRVVHRSIRVTQSNPTHQLTDPTQPNPLQLEKFGPHPTQPNTTNDRAYSLIVTYFIHRTYRFPVPVRSAVKSNLTAWWNQILSSRALKALT